MEATLKAYIAKIKIGLYNEKESLENDQSAPIIQFKLTIDNFESDTKYFKSYTYENGISFVYTLYSVNKTMLFFPFNLLKILITMIF